MFLSITLGHWENLFNLQCFSLSDFNEPNCIRDNSLSWIELPVNNLHLNSSVALLTGAEGMKGGGWRVDWRSSANSNVRTRKNIYNWLMVSSRDETWASTCWPVVTNGDQCTGQWSRGQHMLVKGCGVRGGLGVGVDTRSLHWGIGQLAQDTTLVNARSWLAAAASLQPLTLTISNLRKLGKLWQKTSCCWRTLILTAGQLLDNIFASPRTQSNHGIFLNNLRVEWKLDRF